MTTRTVGDLPTGVVTVLLADIEGSVEHWEAEADGMAKAIESMEGVVDRAVSANRGARPLEQGEGDSFVVAFARPTDAVACAIDIQAGLRDHPDTPSLRVRMALHTDEAQLRDDSNYMGALMNRAARLKALAGGGQVLLSGATQGLVAGAIPAAASLVDLGTHRLRDVPQPHRIWQLLHPALSPDLLDLETPDVLATNLPAQVTTFVGRATELLAARKLLHENRLVTITGAGGAGKTRLALELAMDAFDAYPAGAWFVDLTDVNDPADVSVAVSRVLHLSEGSTHAATERIAAHIADDRVLLVIDNCERVVGAVAALVDAVLRDCARLDVVTTSREPLNTGGEALYRIPPLTIPADGTAIDTAAIADLDSVQLFAERAYLADPEFALDDRTARTALAICSRVDGLPLAIELAAARLRTMSLDGVASTLPERLDILSGGSRTAHDRQRSVASCVAWSYDLLSESEQAVLRRLAVFVGTFALDAAEAVVSSGDEPRGEALDVILALVDSAQQDPSSQSCSAGWERGGRIREATR